MQDKAANRASLPPLRIPWDEATAQGSDWKLGDRKRPVGWYDPGTILEVAKAMWRRRSTKSIDPRRRYAMQPSSRQFDLDVSDQDEFWVDYAGDVGDGFDAGFSVLWSINDEDHNDPGRGEIGQSLILGGDQVYPTPTAEGYRDRLTGPLHAAHPRPIDPDNPRRIFSIPGNHDYYDALDEYANVLLTEDHSQKWIGGYLVHQRRSYWVLRMPHDWLFVGADLGDGYTLDEVQQRYLLDRIRQAKNDPKTGEVIKCVLFVATPAWLYGDSHKAASSIKELEQLISQLASIEMTIAGDRHCYIRHVATENRKGGQPVIRMTAGNSGAFLHFPRVEPTRPTFDNEQYEKRKSYPSAEKKPNVGQISGMQKLMLANPVRFVARNPGFLPIAGLVALLSGVAWAASVGRGPDGFWRGQGMAKLWPFEGGWGAWQSGWGAWPILFMLFVFFLAGAALVLPPPDIIGGPRWFWKIVGGVFGAILVSVVGLGPAWVAVLLGDYLQGYSRLIIFGVALALGAACISLAVGVLLWIQALAGVSSTAVYGGANIDKYRSWVRMCVSADGVRVIALGINTPAHSWIRSDRKSHTPRVRPEGDVERRLRNQVHVIEEFTLVGAGKIRYRSAST